MDIYEAWTKALKQTEIIRSRVSLLHTFQSTHVPYILLSESELDAADTVVRKGEVTVEKPSLILPPNIPQLEGFELDRDQSFNEQSIVNFLLIRGVSLPSVKYNNKTSTLDIFEGRLEKAVSHHLKQLQQDENVSAGLLIGPQDVWQFSLLIFICSQIARNTEIDMRRLIDEHKKRGL